jgi:hypothetical protein
MKRLIRAAIILVFLIDPCIGDAAYRIQLKNGREIITSRYWEEGSEIKFYSDDGVMGIPKDLVRQIEQSDLPEKKATKETATKETDEQKATKPTPMADGEVATGNQTGDAKVDIKEYKEKKLLLKRKFDEAWERYLEASKNKDLEAKEKARQEMIEFSGQVYDLADELKAKNKGVLPDWWEEKSR